MQLSIELLVITAFKTFLKKNFSKRKIRIEKEEKIFSMTPEAYLLNFLISNELKFVSNEGKPSLLRKINILSRQHDV